MMVDRRLWFRHRCFVCKLLFVSERDLVLHEATHEKPNLVCSLCSEAFETAEEYKFHADVGCESQSSVQVCGYCGAVFEQARDLYDHHSSMHLNDQKFQCKFCSANFSWPENLEKHEMMHQTNSSMCKSCGAIFASMASLKVHLWKAHSVNIQDQGSHMVEMRVACNSHNQECKSIGTSTNLCFACQNSMSEDSASRQNEAKLYKCSLCNWTFKYDFSYTLHMKMHEEKLLKSNALARIAEKQANTNNHSKGITETSRLPDAIMSQSNKCDTPETVSTNTKKTVYIRRSDISHNFATMSKPPVLLLKRSSEPPKLTTSQDKNNESVNQAILTNNVTTREHFERRSPACKSQTSHNPPGSKNAFTCKTCMVTFQYDFSYVAHMNYHKRVQQLDSENDDICLNSEYSDSNTHMSFMPKSQLPSCEILMNGENAIVNADGSILIKVDDAIQQSLMGSLSLKMYNFADNGIPVVCPTPDLNKSSTKYILIQSEQDVNEPKSIAALDAGCNAEEVIDIDGGNPSILELSYLPEGSRNCLDDKFVKDTSNEAQVLIVDNSDEFPLNSDMQLPSGQLELDGIADVPIDDSYESNTEKSEHLKGIYFNVLVDNAVPAAKNVFTELGNGTGEKVHRCSFCHAEFRWKTSLTTHMKKHLKKPKKTFSNLRMLKDRETVLRTYNCDK